MIKPAVSALALALALAACGNPAETTAPSAATELTADQKAEVSKELNEWFDVKFEEALQESPITMTFSAGRT
jgi:ABC-type glycerol-3-phosphate transport system substrate-binding protein